MNTFSYIVLGIMVAFNIGICIWFVKRSRETDAEYEAAMDRIYGRK